MTPISEGQIYLVPPNALRGLPHFKIGETQRGKQGAYSPAWIIQASRLRQSPSTHKDQQGHVQMRALPRTSPGEMLWKRTQSRQASPALAGLGTEEILIKHAAGRTLVLRDTHCRFWGRSGLKAPIGPSADPLWGSQPSLCRGALLPVGFATPLAGMWVAAETPRNWALSEAAGGPSEGLLQGDGAERTQKAFLCRRAARGECAC